MRVAICHWLFHENICIVSLRKINEEENKELLIHSATLYSSLFVYLGVPIALGRKRERRRAPS